MCPRASCVVGPSAGKFHAWVYFAVLMSNPYGLLAVQQSMQPKAAVEFDQAINYVNKIKVRPHLTLAEAALAIKQW